MERHDGGERTARLELGAAWVQVGAPMVALVGFEAADVEVSAAEVSLNGG